MKLLTVICACISLVFGAPQGQIGGRIIGGEDGDITNYPYTLQLEYYDELVCGAILVSTKYALTAAHCVITKYIENFIVRAGSSLLYEDGQEFVIQEILFHPKYEFSSNNYDAALLLLSGEAEAPNAKPIELASNDDAIVEGVNVTVTGWGWTDFTYYAEFSPTLQAIELPILSDEQCMSAYDLVTEGMFCIAYLEAEGRGHCNGDNGGPAVIDGVLVGILSFGQGCGDGVHAGVLIRASTVREWVLSVIDDN